MHAHTHTSAGAFAAHGQHSQRGASEGNGGEHHVSSLRLLAGVLVALLVLTALTVFTAREVNLGEAGNLVVAIAIATVKAVLVGAFFMHLLHDARLNAIVMFFCVLAVITFLMFTLIDLGSRGVVDPMRDVATKHPSIVDAARENAAALEAQDGSSAAEHGVSEH